MENGTARDDGEATIPRGWRMIIVCGLFILVGANLRTVILAVPPVLPLVKHDLGLSYTATGLLTSLPVLLMASAAWPAGIFAGRVGARTSVTVGLVLLAAGAVLRAVWPVAVPVYLFTVLLSLGIAIAQTAMPVLARQWFPTRIGLVSALFSDGLIVGEAIAAGITLPIMLHLLGQDAWAGTFVLWSVPVVVALALWLWLAPAAPALAATRALWPRRRQARPADETAAEKVLRRPGVNPWHLGILLGAGSLVFFCMNGWIATYNLALHREAITPLALVVLNAAQLPVSLGMTAFAQQLAGRRWPFIAAGTLCCVAIVGWVVSPGSAEPVWAALLGGSSAFVFVLGIALPPLLATREDVARLTGLTLTLSYGVAFLGPLAGGWLWDLLRLPALAFAPVAVAGVALVVLGALLPSRAAFGLVGATHAGSMDTGADIGTTVVSHG